jgi:nitrogen-specific signal transduction histidine kinase
VVNKHHGDLRVDSQPGDMRFQVRLPLSYAPLDTSDAERKEPA